MERCLFYVRYFLFQVLKKKQKGTGTLAAVSQTPQRSFGMRENKRLFLFHLYVIIISVAWVAVFQRRSCLVVRTSGVCRAFGKRLFLPKGYEGGESRHV